MSFGSKPLILRVTYVTVRSLHPNQVLSSTQIHDSVWRKFQYSLPRAHLMIPSVYRHITTQLHNSRFTKSAEASYPQASPQPFAFQEAVHL